MLGQKDASWGGGGVRSRRTFEPRGMLVGEEDGRPLEQCAQCANYWAPLTRKRHQQEHRPRRPTEVTGRSMRREERVTVQVPVKKQQLDGMSHKGGGNGARILVVLVVGGGSFLGLCCPLPLPSASWSSTTRLTVFPSARGPLRCCFSP